MKRYVLLGASNARRCLPTIFSAARAASREPVALYGAIGHGRSYGSTSSVLGRSIRGILESGLWAALEKAAPSSLTAMLTDAGNDILYGFPVARILAWAGECVSRLDRLGARITVMGLPVETIERLGPARFLLFRSILFPSSRLRLGRVRDSVRELDRELRALAQERKLRFVEPRVEWYGFDPIHIRFRDARPAWAEILGTTPAPGGRLRPIDALRIRLARPERDALFGTRHVHAQPAFRAGDGSEIRLY